MNSPFDTDPSDTHRKVVASLAARGYTPDQIAKATGLSKEVVRALVRELEARRRR